MSGPAKGMQTIAAISLLAPAMLAGLALLALPIAAHLLHRRARRRVVFPSIMLLAASSASQSSFFKLRRWLLLMLRCLAVILLALAFAQPLWESGQSIAAGESDEQATVVLLDLSASTGQTVDGVSLFEWLRGAAARAAEDAAGRGRRVNVVPVDGQPRPLFPEMTQNVDAVRGELSRLRPSAERANLAAGFAEAGKLLSAVSGERELVVVSDFQASNWDEALRGAVASALPADVRVTLAPPEAEPPANAAIMAARCSPAQPFPGREAVVTATLVNLGPRDRVVPVTLKLGGETVAQTETLVEAGGRRDVSLPFRVDTPGDHALTLHLPVDGLAVDNTHHLAVHAVEHQTVALITDESAEVGSARYFIARALAPQREERASYEVAALRPDEVTAETLAGVACVVVTPGAALNDAAAGALEAHLRAGGGVILFTSGGGGLDALAQRDLLPADVRGQHDLTGRGGQHIGPGDWRSPLLRAFDARAQEALSRVVFLHVADLAEPHPEATVLLRFEDNRPALVQRPIGSGRLVLVAFSPAADAGDLAKHGSFVALLHSLVTELTPQTSDPAGVVGQPLRITLNDGAIGSGGVRLVGPSDEPLGAFDLTASGTRATLVVPRPQRSGFYRVERADQAIAAAAANVDPRESDLRRIDPTVVGEALKGSAGVQVTTADVTGDAAALEARPLWGWAVLAALGVLAVELGLLSWWRR